MRFLSKPDRWVCNSTHRILGFLEARLAPFTLMVLIVVLTLSILFWDSWSWQESGSMAIRNLVLVIATIAALSLAIWRSKVAERQAETAQRGLLNERYQKGAEMLSSKVLTVRLGGIYTLERLAREHPRDYHTQIMNLLCAFVRHPTEKTSESPRRTMGQPIIPDDEAPRVRDDVQAVMTAIGSRSDAQIKIEEKEGYRMDLTSASLAGVDLRKASLAGVDLHGAILVGASLVGVNLRGANLDGASLAGVYLTAADLDGATLFDANLDGAILCMTNLEGCIGLAQERLDRAVAPLGGPPNLTAAVDAKTSEPLVWKGGVSRHTDLDHLGG